MPYSIRFTPVGATASVSGLDLAAVLRAAADLETAGHRDIVVMDEAGDDVGFAELERLVVGHRFPTPS